ncbi:MAG: hypothetical protein PW792_15015 [Acidobacteriaceae bacterium]|nr:hypothetical protein [Acidobacteriaceae bacterium]
MKMTKLAAKITLATLLAAPVASIAQTVHQDAKRAQDRSDKRHHTTAKVVGGSAVGGAVVGGLVGGGKGAVIGGAVGAGGGLLADKARKNHDVKKRERNGHY